MQILTFTIFRGSANITFYKARNITIFILLWPIFSLTLRCPHQEQNCRSFFCLDTICCSLFKRSWQVWETLFWYLKDRAKKSQIFLLSATENVTHFPFMAIYLLFISNRVYLSWRKRLPFFARTSKKMAIFTLFPKQIVNLRHLKGNMSLLFGLWGRMNFCTAVLKHSNSTRLKKSMSK